MNLSVLYFYLSQSHGFYEELKVDDSGDVLRFYSELKTMSLI